MTEESAPIAPSDRTPTTPLDFWTQVDHWFQGFPERFELPGWSVYARSSPSPYTAALADVADRGTHYEITAELPGIPKESIDLRVHGSTLEIEAKADVGSTEEKKGYLRRERISSGYHRQIELPESLRADEVSARYENGVLTVTVPKAHPAVERKVPIQ